MAKGDLTPKQQRFVAEYLVDLNGKQAAIRAGCSPKSAEVTASKWLIIPKVRAAVDARKAKRAAKVEVKADDVLRELQTFGHFDPKGLYDDKGAWLPVPQMPEHVRRAIAGIEIEEIYDADGTLRGYTKKVKFWPKHRGLEMLGKHVKLFGDEAGGSVTNIFQVQNNQLTVQLDYSRLTVDEHRTLLALVDKATPPEPKSE